jgi:type VI secretion system protein ImpH
MADDSRTTQPDVAGLSAGERPAESRVFGLDFFQTLRRIECEHRDRPRLGEAVDPAQEPVRLRQVPSLAFPGSMLVSEEPSDERTGRKLGVSFFGLFGPNGPMPLHVSDHVYQRLHRHRDPTFARFADIFHHRLLLFFYRAWANAQPTVCRDRPERDGFARAIGALVGLLGKSAPADRVDLCMLSTAGHFVGHSRHPEGLEKVLSELFQMPARIEEFVAEWLPIPDEHCWRLSGGALGSGALGQLGTSTRVGTEVLERQFKFRIVLGPMDERVHERFLPGADGMAQLLDLVRRYLGHELNFDVCLIITEGHAPGARLGRSGRLGQTSYLGTSGARGPSSTRTQVLDPLAQAS